MRQGNGEVEVQMYLAEISGRGCSCFCPIVCFHIHITILDFPHFCVPISRDPGKAVHTAGFPLLAVLYQSCLEVEPCLRGLN